MEKKSKRRVRGERESEGGDDDDVDDNEFSWTRLEKQNYQQQLPLNQLCKINSNIF